MHLVVSDATKARGDASSFKDGLACVTHLMHVAACIHRKDDQRKAGGHAGLSLYRKSPSSMGVLQGRREVLRSRGSERCSWAEEAAAYLAFPATHTAQIRTNNVQREREVTARSKRRTRVVRGSFECFIRLGGEQLMSRREVVGALSSQSSRTPGRLGRGPGEAVLTLTGGAQIIRERH